MILQDEILFELEEIGEKTHTHSSLLAPPSRSSSYVSRGETHTQTQEEYYTSLLMLQSRSRSLLKKKKKSRSRSSHLVVFISSVIRGGKE